MNDLPSQSDTYVLQDIPCIRCGYNLRTLPTDGQCPECAAPVADALRPDSLYFADPSWLRRLHQGTTILIMALVTWHALVLCAFLLPYIIRRVIGVPAIVGLLLLAPVVLLVTAGVFLLLVRERPVGSQRRAPMLLYVAQAAVSTSAAWFLLVVCLPSLQVNPPWIVTALAPVAWAVLIGFAITIAALRLQKAARRAGRAKLAAWTGVLIFTIIFSAAQQLVGGLILLFQEMRGRSTTLFPHLNTVMMLTALSAGFLASALMILYRRMLSSILRGSIAQRSDQNAHHASVAAE